MFVHGNGTWNLWISEIESAAHVLVELLLVSSMQSYTCIEQETLVLLVIFIPKASCLASESGVLACMRC